MKIDCSVFESLKNSKETINWRGFLVMQKMSDKESEFSIYIIFCLRYVKCISLLIVEWRSMCGFLYLTKEGEFKHDVIRVWHPKWWNGSCKEEPNVNDTFRGSSPITTVYYACANTKPPVLLWFFFVFFYFESSPRRQRKYLDLS